MDVATKVGAVAFVNFAFLTDGQYDIIRIHDAKARGVELIPILDGEGRIIELINFEKQRSHLSIDTVLMAGGKGERLRPLTEKTPKPLTEMDGKAIIRSIRKQKNLLRI